VPEPGSKKYDTKRARLRKEAERSGISDKDANEAANEALQDDPERAGVGAPSGAGGRRESARRTPSAAARGAVRAGSPGSGAAPLGVPGPVRRLGRPR
jgi:hypothetical protein